jgi:hypothetical protein
MCSSPARQSTTTMSFALQIRHVTLPLASTVQSSLLSTSNCECALRIHFSSSHL